jgi:hypothetical protein
MIPLTDRLGRVLVALLAALLAIGLMSIVLTAKALLAPAVRVPCAPAMMQSCLPQYRVFHPSFLPASHRQHR